MGGVMLTIRQKQMDALAAVTRERFQERLEAHVRKVFPDDCKALGEDGVRELVVEGIERAEGHGLSAERDVCRYVDLLFLLGRDFETREEMAWAKGILNDVTLREAPSVRMDRLWEETRRRRAAGRLRPRQA